MLSGAVILSGCPAAQGAPFASPRTDTEFWFVEANEGQSAGGHAALRIGPRVYHLEHRGDGLIADRRTSPHRFIEVYSERGNRRIEAIPLDLNDAQIRALENHLQERFFARTQMLHTLDGLEDEIRWLAAVDENGALSLRLPGTGLFEIAREANRCHKKPSRVESSDDIREALLIRLTTRFGSDFLRDRLLAARHETARRVVALLDRAESETKAVAGITAVPDSLGSLVQAARTEFAFDLLLLGCEGRLRKEVLIPTQTPLGADRAAWLRIEEQLAGEIEALLESPRSDIGLPLLLAWARIQAIAETLASNQIHVLAPFEERPSKDVHRFAKSSISVADEIPTAWQIQRARDVEARWTRSLSELIDDDGPLEARLLAIERAHHAFRHFKERTLHQPIRPESHSPSAAEVFVAAERILPWPSDLPFSRVSEAQITQQVRAAALRRSLEGELRYGLFTRNCVTELSAALETIRTRNKGSEPDSPQRALLFAGTGGRLSPGEMIRGAFIPEVVAFRVEHTLASHPRRILPSTRERALAQEREKIRGPLSRWAFEGREFTALTSQTYRPNQDDSRFLFFADGPVAMRPLIGVANLSYGLSASLFGLFEAPFDRGVGLRRGLQGVAMSVPELFFFQVRHGSYRVAPPRALAPSAGSTETR